jgi:hypothetical protein
MERVEIYMGYKTPTLGEPGPVGDDGYTIVEGDCVESIAFNLGYLPDTIWKHPQNSELRKTRVCENMLLPGDRLFIPKKVMKTVDRPTDQRHLFVRKGLPCKLRLCIQRVGVPRRNVPYLLVVDGRVFNGNTDDEGWIEVAIPPNAREGELTVGDELDQQVIPLQLGGMDPITEIVGIQKRLRNLGYACDPTGQMDEVTSAAIAMFQEGEKLKPTGELDQTTIEKLKERYGS